MIVRATEELFNQWIDLKGRIQSIASIVQNPDAEITEKEYQQWYGQINLFMHDFKKLVNQTDGVIEGRV